MNLASLKPVEMKAFIPSKDFEVSKSFYQAFGFILKSDGHGVAYFHLEECSFLLQDFYTKELAENFMMHLLVEDVRAWYADLSAKDIANKFQVKITPPEERPWEMIDFTITDPSGVLWRIAQNI